MSYTPTQWNTGDIVTAEKLNKMEQGIEKNSGYWIPLQYSNGILSVPADKVDEVNYALYNPDSVFINGAVINNSSAFFCGYHVDNNKFYCPLSAEAMEEIGMSGTGNIIIKPSAGNEDVSVEVVSDTFIVTCTPTALDYSGTTDKTIAEIYSAYQAGKKIVFRVLTGTSTYVDVECTSTDNIAQRTYPAFNAFIIMQSNNVLIYARFGNVDAPEYINYSTYIYTLTPAT